MFFAGKLFYCELYKKQLKPQHLKKHSVMKKSVISLILSCLSSLTVFADPTQVETEVTRNTHPVTPDRDRAPMRVPVEIFYDLECSTVTVIGPDVDGTVRIINGDSVIDETDCINASFLLPASLTGRLTILVETEYWTATGILNL